MSDAQENMIVDSEDAPSQPVDRAVKRVLEEPGECEEKELVSLHSGGFPSANYITPSPDCPVEVANTKKRRVDQRESTIQRKLSIYRRPESGSQHIPPLVTTSNPPPAEGDKRFVRPPRNGICKLTVIISDNSSPSSPPSVSKRLSPPILLHRWKFGGDSPSITQNQTRSPVLSPPTRRPRSFSGRRTKSGNLRWRIVSQVLPTFLSPVPIKM